MIEEYVWALFAQSAMEKCLECAEEDIVKSVAIVSAEMADEMMKQFKKRFRKTPWNTESKPETENVYANKIGVENKS